MHSTKTLSRLFVGLVGVVLLFGIGFALSFAQTSIHNVSVHTENVVH